MKISNVVFVSASIFSLLVRPTPAQAGNPIDEALMDTTPERLELAVLKSERDHLRLTRRLALSAEASKRLAIYLIEHVMKQDVFQRLGENYVLAQGRRGLDTYRVRMTDAKTLTIEKHNRNDHSWGTTLVRTTKELLKIDQSSRVMATPPMRWLSSTFPQLTVHNLGQRIAGKALMTRAEPKGPLPAPRLVPEGHSAPSSDPDSTLLARYLQMYVMQQSVFEVLGQGHVLAHTKSGWTEHRLRMTRPEQLTVERKESKGGWRTVGVLHRDDMFTYDRVMPEVGQLRSMFPRLEDLGQFGQETAAALRKAVQRNKTRHQRAIHRLSQLKK